MKNKKRGFASLLLLILIVIIIAGGIYYFWAKQNSAVPATSDIPVDIMEVVRSTSAANNDNASTTPSPDIVELRHSSDHIDPETTVVSGIDRFSGKFTKDIVLPKVKNIANKAAAEEIAKKLTFEKITDSTFAELKESANGIAGMEYEVDYDKGDLLSLSVFMDYMGAYPSWQTFNYSFDLRTGKQLTAADLFYPEKIPVLKQMLTTKLKKNMENALLTARNDNPNNHDGLCSEEVMSDQMDSNKRYDSSYGTYAKDPLIFSVTEKGIEFPYDFSFPHVMVACEPDQLDVLSFAELKQFIRADGLLGAEIK